MIKINYYQVFRNCEGDVIVPEGLERKKGMPRGAIEYEREVSTAKELEDLRSELEGQYTTKETPNVVVMFNTTLIPDL